MTAGQVCTCWWKVFSGIWFVVEDVPHRFASFYKITYLHRQNVLWHFIERSNYNYEVCCDDVTYDFTRVLTIKFSRIMHSVAA